MPKCELEPIPNTAYNRCKHCGEEYRMGCDPGNCKQRIVPTVIQEIREPQELPEFTIDDVTFAITSFERPEHLARLLESIQTYYPNAKVLVADYSEVKPTINFGTLVELEFDIGLSQARNILAAITQTKYMLLLEEDFIFTQNTKIEPFVDILENDTTVGVVGGCLEVDGKIHWYDMNIRKYRNKLVGEKAPNNFISTFQGTPYKYCDMVFNFSLFRKAMLETDKFDNSLKVGEHVPYYWEVKERGNWRVAFTNTTSIKHDMSGRSEKYNEHRKRARKMQASWFHRNNLNQYQQPDNMYGTYRPDNTNVIVLGVGHSGTTILTKLLLECGLSKNDCDREYCESVSVRDMNNRIRNGFYTAEEQRAVIESLEEPWCVKDPRFVHTLDKWYHVFARNPPILLWVQRNFDDVVQSYAKRGELPEHRRKYYVTRFHWLAEQQYNKWPWPKFIVNYENLSNAIHIFKSKANTYHQQELFT